jgi:hypothetical protein
MGIELPRRVAQGLADHLNGALNRTVTDSRLSVRPIAGYADAFRLARIADGAPVARVHIATPRLPLELVVRNLVSDWGVKPRTEDWLPILEDSAKDFGKPN